MTLDFEIFNPLRQSSCRGCIALDIPCNWTRALKPGPPPDISYVKYLEARTKLVETHLKNLILGVSTKKDVDELLKQEPCDIRQQRAPLTTANPNSILTNVADCLDSPALTQLVQRMRLLGVESRQESQSLVDDNALWVDSQSMQSPERMFHGHSSAHVLSRDAAAIRQETFINDSQRLPGVHFRADFWSLGQGIKRRCGCDSNLEVVEHSFGELPPADLLPVLLSAYFDNAIFPVVHRRLFEKQLGEGLHKHEPSFFRLVLLVCANGARWQLELWPRNFLAITRLSLWDVQSLVLAALYLCGSSETYGAWIIVGTAIRMMQAIGSHRMRSSQTLENELHKRCFWSMLLIDRYYGVHLGRNAAMFDWDSDLDNALEVDDDLWSLNPGDTPPVQPSGIVSGLSVFNQVIGLVRLYGRCLQTVYSLHRTKRMLGLSRPQGSSWIFSDINVRLKDWARSLPPHLQLPRPEHYDDSPSFANTINMWGLYYELMISANRPFITESSPLALPALTICRRAAREFASMAITYSNTPGSRLNIGMIHCAFSSAMILVIDLFAETGAFRRAAPTKTLDDPTYNKQRKEEDLRTCIIVLERAETRIHIAGRLRDVIGTYTNAPQLNEPIDITFDIDGPPDVSMTANEAQNQLEDSLGSSAKLASLYEFANPFFQSSRCSHAHECPSAYPTPTATPSHTLFSQANSVKQSQAFHGHLELNQTYPCVSNTSGYTLGL
ncbi:unnamed protein product [Rhizoctonia solani]|uniref:Xylanolytic transcriptional activator regulatory domain-containing protein n=1 Tax=Rhizoctonia solani TaxID=456999 RepID=A0A8H3AS68_9AGAM|nr:unnamed protein product [Rhizoctonia solani]